MFFVVLGLGRREPHCDVRQRHHNNSIQLVHNSYWIDLLNENIGFPSLYCELLGMSNPQPKTFPKVCTGYPSHHPHDISALDATTDTLRVTAKIAMQIVLKSQCCEVFCQKTSWDPLGPLGPPGQLAIRN